MKTWTKKILTGSGLLVTAMMASNVLNLSFNVFLGRELEFDKFGVIALINTLWYFINIFMTALVATITHEVAYLSSKVSRQAGSRFFHSIRKNALITALAITLVYLLATPFISRFFQIRDIRVFLFFTPIIFAGSIAALNRGYLYGNFFFFALASITIMEAITKLFIAVFLVKTDLEGYMFLTIPVSIIASALLSAFFVRITDTSTSDTSTYPFPKKFYIASVITGLSSNIFLSLDITLVKHFLSPTDAGAYAMLALVGKMIYFLGSLVTSFMIAFISRDEGAGRHPHKTFYRLFAIIFVLVVSSTLGFVFFGDIFVPLVFGHRTEAIIKYLPRYSVAIAMFTLSNAIVVYHLARKQYIFPVTAITIGFLMAVGIVAKHTGIEDIVSIMLRTSGIGFVLLVFFHFLQRNGGAVTRNLVDLIFLFLPIPENEPGKAGGKRILIFNWRDTRHSFSGGAEVYIHELAKRWVADGHKVTLFCGNDGKAPRYEIMDGVEVFRRGGFYFVYFWGVLYYLLRFRGKYDIIVDSENGIPFFTPLYAREQIYLLIHHVHQDVFLRSLTPPLSWIASFLEIQLMPFVYQNIQLITVSPSSKKEIMQYGLTSKEPVIVYNGVDLDVLTPGKKARKPTALYLGRLKYYKSVHIFIRAAQKVLETVPDAQFIIAGDGEEKRKLVELTKKLGIEKNVTFLGKVTESMKTDLYRQAWVFVNPSFMEGWGITSIEANACGTPVVASNVPGLKDSVKHMSSGYLVEFGKVDAFAEKIIELFTDDTQRTRMQESARKWAERYDWAKSAKTSIQLFTSYDA